MTYLTRPITAIGQWGLDVLEFLGGVGLLLLETGLAIHGALFTARGRRLGWQNLWAQMVRVGVRSIPIVSLVLFCIGAILALQMARILDRFGLITAIPDIISISIFRELGPLVSAIVLTGFAGASIAAEMGTMVVSEEIEALEAEAIHPMRFLVVPRVIATTVMLVFIAVVGDLMGVFGGLVISYMSLGLGFRQYVQHTFSTAEVRDFVTGLVKAGCFGALISGIACYLGLNVKGGAEGVGDATTRTVVLTIVALIAVDLIFTAVFYALGW
jgi:phospholipid/cholesterol/gamma-HCH transport system permease protein